SLREKLRQSACSRFSTVLGNGADAYHDSHIHLDLLERSNRYKICQWDVLDVAETAVLAAKKAAAAAAPNPAVVNVSDIPFPPPRPVVLSDRSHHRSLRLREAGQRPLFSLSRRDPFLVSSERVGRNDRQNFIHSGGRSR